MPVPNYKRLRKCIVVQGSTRECPRLQDSEVQTWREGSKFTESQSATAVGKVESACGDLPE